MKHVRVRIVLVLIVALCVSLFSSCGSNTAQDVTLESVYDLSVKNGYQGTEEEWLASLAGEVGSNGKSAYELAVENGYKGDVQQWLASLVGKPGKSAYEVAVENGYIGSESDWVKELIATAGTADCNGKSAYDIAVENGFKGTGMA